MGVIDGQTGITVSNKNKNKNKGNRFEEKVEDRQRKRPNFESMFENTIFLYES